MNDKFDYYFKNYTKDKNVYSRFYIINGIDIGDKEKIVFTYENTTEELVIAKTYYAIKDIATGELASNLFEKYNEAKDSLIKLRAAFNEPPCVIHCYKVFLKNMSLNEND